MEIMADLRIDERLTELFVAYCRAFTNAMLGQPVGTDAPDLLHTMAVAFAVEDAKRPNGWDGIHGIAELRLRLEEHLAADAPPTPSPAVDLSPAEIRDIAELIGGLRGHLDPLRLRLLAHLPET